MTRSGRAAKLGAAAALLAGSLSGAMPAGPDLALLMADGAAPKLSDYRLFTDTAGRVPAAGVVRYTLNTPLFSDYAEKSRFILLPPGATAAWRDRGVLDFPVGTTIVKSFAFPADFRAPDRNVRLIETRLLIRKASGWVPQSYVWNADGTDAVLQKAGQRLPISFIDKVGRSVSLSYLVPNQNQCKQCHSQDGAVTPIGPTGANLNGGLDGKGASQLASWVKAGRLDRMPADAPRLVRWDDAGAPLAARARAYLDVNCGHCHSPGGFASNSGLWLQWDEADPAHQGIYKRPVAAGRASGDAEFSITPGQPDRSIIVRRMESNEPGVMMPQFGRSVVHAEGVALVRAFIASLPPAP